MPKKRKSSYTLEEERTFLSEEQTLLSKERTILSFMQTGLAFIVLGIAIVNIFRTMSAEIVGWALVVIGFAEVLESARRFLKYRKKVENLKRRAGSAWI